MMTAVMALISISRPALGSAEFSRAVMMTPASAASTPMAAKEPMR